MEQYLYYRLWSRKTKQWKGISETLTQENTPGIAKILNLH